AVEEHIVASGKGKPVLVVQSFRGLFDQGEKPLASGRNVRTVLNVVRRPETLRSGVVPLVEKRVESLAHPGRAPVVLGSTLNKKLIFEKRVRLDRLVPATAR